MPYRVPWKSAKFTDGKDRQRVVELPMTICYRRGCGTAGSCESSCTAGTDSHIAVRHWPVLILLSTPLDLLVKRYR